MMTPKINLNATPTKAGTGGVGFCGRIAADKAFDKCALFNTLRHESMVWVDMSCDYTLRQAIKIFFTFF